ncbi:putative pre-mRNA splicing factor [Neospora caninum Liverpool]|uniref:Pre-mRNA-processing factor 17 n=1 Tax=Neospora caninum (strain Liverpool) TaxID=572307 RepID=F0VBC7_NEOCL|nr:putative pre-mRNA splicing factor [Neospora caninum Liverpool]CBZ50911.1 putative pre-mRNA splicing factor [Neospora caninum Liverpool]CEL68213.1 TPA: pre-mRNA splicing factor, putative [Neospora caninum Liverpool]|eukprot:XP_003880944.1 putative pre-mRNA splicing factor [Neospora caninum Liverpool]
MDYFASYAEDEAGELAAEAGKGPEAVGVDAVAPAEKAGEKRKEEGGEPREENACISLLPSINCAPPVSLLACKAQAQRNAVFHRPEDTVLMSNPKVEALQTPLQGPLTPQQVRRGGWTGVYRRRLAGDVEKEHVNVEAFDRQFYNFQFHGRAEDPSNFTRDALLAHNSAGADSDASKVREAVAYDTRGFVPEGEASRRQKRRRLRNDDATSDDFQGPWAPFEPEAVEASGVHTPEDGEAAATEADQGEDAEKSENGGAQKAKTRGGAASFSKDDAVDSIFHGKSATDYQGRSWLDVPPGTKELPPDSACFPPKREIHAYVGHTGGVQAIRFFPRSGHLLLSASMDSTVKIWDVLNQRKLYRTYTAHKQAVRDIQWAEEGRRFYSCSFDNTVKLWDTEAGKVIGSFGNGKTPYCVTVNPNDNNVFVVGSANRRAVQFDARTGNIEVEYAEHIGSVNTVTFCEEGRRLVTTADDKKLFVWEYGIPVVIKHVSEPDMHSMPAAAKHPSEKYLCFQSMDNQILTYDAYGKFRMNPRKKFKGHLCAGYACKPAFSPDGKWLLSGDGNGKLWIWNWKNGKNIRTLQAHDQVCIDCQWHPNMTSRVATCGWDGLIKLWD